MIITRATPGAGYIKVYIDGKYHTRCIAVDDETGEAQVEALDENGKPYLDYVNGDPDYDYLATRWIKADIELEEDEPGILNAMGWKGGRR